MMPTNPGCRYYLTQAGIDLADAHELRKISMTLHRWHEMECGDSNGHGSWTVARGRRLKDLTFEHDDNGKPWIEYHSHATGRVVYNPTPDRERGALKRLEAIMARYPGWAYYVQGDPRGCALYMMPPGEMASREPGWLEANYNRGIAVHK